MITVDGYVYADDMAPCDPHAVSVKPLPDYWLEVAFENGETRCFDVKPYLTGDWYGELLDPDFFVRVRVAALSIEWPGGQDIAPDDLYPLSIPCLNAH